MSNPSAPAPAFSLVVPAYNEAKRLPAFLPSIRMHLSARYGEAYEVIVVDDGSRDSLVPILREAAREWTQLRWIEHPENRGKGAAVRTGVLAARGDVILFADADGATPIEEETRLADALAAGPPTVGTAARAARVDVAIGSRLMPGEGIRRQRRAVRSLVGRGFAGLVRRMMGLSVLDTQCGFKMFRADAARQLFSQGIETGYLLDVELLMLANRLGLRVVEVPVHWHEVPGGNIRLFRDMPRVARDLWRLRRRMKS